MASELPPTRIISWQQLVQDADPDWQRLKMRPWVYEFSNGRRFLWDPNVYTAGEGSLFTLGSSPLGGADALGD